MLADSSAYVRVRRSGAQQLRIALAWLGLCAAWACGQSVEVPVGPGALPIHMWQVVELSEELAHAHPQEMPPSRWATVQAQFFETQEPAGEAFAHALQAERCAQTQGRWHAALWACQCPARMAFVPRAGCTPLPPVIAAQSFCTSLDWLTIKTACLRDIQIGRSAWHLHFAGRAMRTQAVRQILADGDAGALVGHTLSVPPAKASWSMHLTDRLGPQPTPFLGFTQQHGHLLPDQYTQAWVRPSASILAHEDLARLADTCRKALVKQPLLPASAAGKLCERAAEALTEVLAANADAWPTDQSTTWQTEGAAQMPTDARLGALVWRLSENKTAPSADVFAVWRVVLRDEVVIGRALHVTLVRTQMAAAELEADAASDAAAIKSLAAWQLTLVCDGAGVVQAWHIVSPESSEQTGLMLGCHKMLKPRKAKRTKLVLGARAP